MEGEILANTVSQFGLYLGAVEQEDPAAVYVWIVVVVMDNLSMISKKIEAHGED